MIMGRFSSQSAFLSLLLPFAIMCNLAVCELKASCNEKDKQILLCFKHGLTDSSNMLSTWSNKKDCCEWRGIQCNINGRVTNISLPCSTDDTVYGIKKNKTHCLAGELNLSLFELEFLNYLDLNNNNFKAMHFSLNCQNLSLVNTPLGRSRNFSNLAYLDLSQNKNIVMENWKSLVHVNLGNNHLTGKIPHSMGTLSNLLSLQLDFNSLHGEIPMSLKNCQKLVILSLSENKFFGSIPNWIGQDMKALQLRSNEFSGNIPLQICQLSSLIVLDLADNRLTGIIPHCLLNITAMIFNNASRGDEFGEKFFITYALGRGSRITIAVSLPLLTKGNERGNYMYMHVLDLSNNHLVGKVPSEIFRLTALESLNLSHNQLMGTIPTEIGNMKQLESLDFSNNTLSGEIPQSMSALSFLSFLNLSFNNLRGQIPLGTQLQSFTALSYEGNPELCGSPLIKKCKYDEAPGPGDTKLIRNDEKGSELLEWFYMGTGVGFATSFLIVCGSIFFIQKWRHAYFRFVGDVKDKLYVKMVLKCTPSVEI